MRPLIVLFASFLAANAAPVMINSGNALGISDGDGNQVSRQILNQLHT
jgi:hypothetical protein